MNDFRDPMAILAIVLAAVVLVIGGILDVAFQATGATGQPGPGPGQTPSAGPSPIGSPTFDPTDDPSASPDPLPSGQITILSPAFAEASASAPPVDRGGGVQDTYTAGNAVDDDRATAWCIEGEGIGHFLVLGFDREVEIAEVALIPGYDKIDPATGEDRFFENRRIEEVRVIVDDETFTGTLDPSSRSLQGIPVEARRTQGVGIEIVETTEPGAPNRDFTCISEVLVSGYG